MIEHDIVTHLARFAGALRDREISVGLVDEIDGTRALTLVDLLDRTEVRIALCTALKIQRKHQEQFDELFDRWWTARRESQPSVDYRTRPPSDRSVPVRPVHAFWRQQPQPEEPEGAATEGDLPGYSPEVLLRRKPFDAYSAHDLLAMERILARLASKFATRRSRRLVPTRGRGTVDLRHSFRRSIGTGGDLISFARRSRAVEQPRFVLLCDTSGSMDPHTRFLLTFVLSLKKVARYTEVFAFNTSLTRLTRWLSPGKIGPTLDRLAAGVPDWSGGTKIGASLAEFVTRHHNKVVDGKTVVVILSDGLDRGEPAGLIRPMQAIHRRARKVIWLNPLLGDPRYEPTARGMAAALPFVDHFAPAHNLESLERVISLLAA